jgi:hypothetical protein
MIEHNKPGKVAEAFVGGLHDSAVAARLDQRHILVLHVGMPCSKIPAQQEEVEAKAAILFRPCDKACYRQTRSRYRPPRL